MNRLKPRFNRSQIPVVAKKYNTFTHGTLRDSDKVQWNKMSKETFEEMCEKGLLSDEQIIQWQASQKGSKKSIRLINKLAELDLSTIDGLKAFKEILDKEPKAINAVSDAAKVRKSRGL